jgi:hypothetical protein
MSTTKAAQIAQNDSENARECSDAQVNECTEEPVAASDINVQNAESNALSAELQKQHDAYVEAIKSNNSKYNASVDHWVFASHSESDEEIDDACYNPYDDPEALPEIETDENDASDKYKWHYNDIYKHLRNTKCRENCVSMFKPVYDAFTAKLKEHYKNDDDPEVYDALKSIRKCIWCAINENVMKKVNACISNHEQHMQRRDDIMKSVAPLCSEDKFECLYEAFEDVYTTAHPDERIAAFSKSFTYYEFCKFIHTMRYYHERKNFLELTSCISDILTQNERIKFKQFDTIIRAYVFYNYMTLTQITWLFGIDTHDYTKYTKPMDKRNKQEPTGKKLNMTFDAIDAAYPRIPYLTAYVKHIVVIDLDNESYTTKLSYGHNVLKYNDNAWINDNSDMVSDNAPIVKTIANGRHIYTLDDTLDKIMPALDKPFAKYIQRRLVKINDVLGLDIKDVDIDIMAVGDDKANFITLPDTLAYKWKDIEVDTRPVRCFTEIRKYKIISNQRHIVSSYIDVLETLLCESETCKVDDFAFIKQIIATHLTRATNNKEGIQAKIDLSTYKHAIEDLKIEEVDAEYELKGMTEENVKTLCDIISRNAPPDNTYNYNRPIHCHSGDIQYKTLESALYAIDASYRNSIIDALHNYMTTKTLTELKEKNIAKDNEYIPSNMGLFRSMLNKLLGDDAYKETSDCFKSPISKNSDTVVDAYVAKNPFTFKHEDTEFTVTNLYEAKIAMDRLKQAYGSDLNEDVADYDRNQKISKGHYSNDEKEAATEKVDAYEANGIFMQYIALRKWRQNLMRRLHEDEIERVKHFKIYDLNNTLPFTWTDFNSRITSNFYAFNLDMLLSDLSKVVRFHDVLDVAMVHVAQHHLYSTKNITYVIDTIVKEYVSANCFNTKDNKTRNFIKTTITDVLNIAKAKLSVNCIRFRFTRPGDDPNKTLKIYHGLATEPYLKADDPEYLANISYGMLNDFEKLIKEYICDGREDQIELLLDWLAFIVKYPGIKTTVAMILRGLEGTGKSTLANIMTALIGDLYAKANIPIEQAAGQFTGMIEGLIFAGINEPTDRENTKATMKDYTDAMKELITEAEKAINKKGINAYNAEIPCNIMITTNNFHIIKSSIAGRRYHYFDTSAKSISDPELFNRLNRLIKIEGFRKTLLTYLLLRNVSETRFRHFTPTQNDIIALSTQINASEQYILDNWKALTSVRGMSYSAMYTSVPKCFRSVDTLIEKIGPFLQTSKVIFNGSNKFFAVKTGKDKVGHYARLEPSQKKRLLPFYKMRIREVDDELIDTSAANEENA